MRKKQTVKSKVYQLKLHDGGLTETDRETAAELNRYFVHVFVKDMNNVANNLNQPQTEVNKLEADLDEISSDAGTVLKKLQILHENKAPGHWRIQWGDNPAMPPPSIPDIEFAPPIGKIVLKLLSACLLQHSFRSILTT